MALLASCGDPDPKPPDVYFKSRAWLAKADSARRESARAPSRDSAAGAAAAKTPKPPPPSPSKSAPPRIELAELRGVVRRIDGADQFRRCGTHDVLRVRADPEAGARLREWYRFETAVSPERPLYAVVTGTVLEDSVVVAGGRRVVATDSAGRVVRFFYMATLDTLRFWRAADCGGEAPVPR